MPELALTFFPPKCRVAGCNRSAGVFSVCKEHEERELRVFYLKMVRDGQAPHFAPPCFPSEQAFREYAVAFKLSQASGTGKQFMVDPCRDCTPKYRDAMAAAGRCQHPETVFILSSRFAGDRIGVPLQDEKKAAAWESAIMGLSGPVVGLPSPDVIDQAVTRISAKRKIGRPKKGEQR